MLEVFVPSFLCVWNQMPWRNLQIKMFLWDFFTYFFDDSTSLMIQLLWWFNFFDDFFTYFFDDSTSLMIQFLWWFFHIFLWWFNFFDDSTSLMIFSHISLMIQFLWWFNFFDDFFTYFFDDSSSLMIFSHISLMIQLRMWEILDQFLPELFKIFSQEFSNLLVRGKWLVVLFYVIQVIYCWIKFQTIQFSISIVFVYKQLNVKTVLFQAIQFSISTQFSFI